MIAGWRFWAWPWELARCGVLGMNARNLELLTENPRPLHRLADDKTVTKEICRQNGIPVPATIAIIERFGQLRDLAAILADRREFVIKPARGAGGRGVLVIVDCKNENYIAASGLPMTLEDLREHAAAILSGQYCVTGQNDKAIIEQRIAAHPIFGDLVDSGTPDLRIVLKEHHPLAAMLRLPTTGSRGRANLHQGAVGVGIDVATGLTTLAVHRGRRVADHPDKRSARGRKADTALAGGGRDGGKAQPRDWFGVSGRGHRAGPAGRADGPGGQRPAGSGHTNCQ